MLKIRIEQLSEFEDGMRRDLLRRMLLYLREYFPECCDEKEDAVLQDFVEASLMRATELGFYFEQEVLKYLGLEVIYGAGFYNKYKWASEILVREDLFYPEDKMEALYDVAIKHLKAEA